MNATEDAIQYITNCCPIIGAFSGTFEPNAFLKKVSEEISRANSSYAFPDRHKEHIAYAVDMVASNPFLSSPSAIASLYLATRFELYFRVISCRLNADGTWKTPQDKTQTKAVLEDSRLKKDRISSLALAYRIMKSNQRLSLAKVCAKLDELLYPVPSKTSFGKQISDIGDRIEVCRHEVGHGHWGDISSEAIFYGLMTAIVFHNQT